AKGHPPVHSFYYNKDQLGLQDQFFRGRTSLFKDQISRGNASLQLTGVEVQDQGRYRCHTSTMRGNKDSLINLRVDAASYQIDIDFSGDVVTCAAEGIFPAPTLTWSTDPPADAQLLQNKTKVIKVTTFGAKLTLVLRELIFLLLAVASVLASAGSSVKISCSLPRTVPQSFNVTWRFRRSHPIVSISVVDQRSQAKVWDQWKPRVITNFSASGGLHLHSLKSEHQGAYTCEVNTPEEMYVTWTDVTVTEGKGLNQAVALLITTFTNSKSSFIPLVIP
uniref:Ig-like domain-containing protein n=1 Tax=Lates calcarifer TaxID=8187 RepID=A0A4W6G373_LATCA